jgi:hypothetical protein
MLEKLRVLGCNMSLKLLFLHSHLDYFPHNLGAFCEEQGKRFHRDLKEMERQYQGHWDVNMMADYCWSLKQEGRLLPEAITDSKHLHVHREEKAGMFCPAS